MADHKSLLKQLIEENVKRALIYEGLIFSYPVSYVIKTLKKEGFNDISYNNRFISIRFYLSENNQKYYNGLNHFMDVNCGWKHGSSIANGKVIENKMDFIDIHEGVVTLQYEPKFDVEIDKTPTDLFHLTVEKNIEKILKKGLIPKSSENFFFFNDRIYLSKTKEALYDFIKQKFNLNYKSRDNKFFILRVNPNKSIKFFRDPLFEEGIYTLENIAPQNLKLIEEIEINEKGEITNITKLK